MLETGVIAFAIAAAIAILGVTFWAARLSDRHFQKRDRDAAAGGRPLSRTERIIVVQQVHNPLSADAAELQVPTVKAAGLVVATVICGFILGGLVADALGAEGIEVVLIVGGTSYVLSWCWMGPLMLRRRRQRDRDAVPHS